MKTFLKAYGFTVLVGICVGGYHAVNLSERRFLNPMEDWKLSRLEMKLGHETLSIGFASRNLDSLHTGLASQNVFQPKQLDVVRFVPVDPAAGLIAHTGYAFRYLGGQVRNDILLAGSRPKESFFWRDEIWLQYPSAAREMTRGLGSKIVKVVQYFESKGITVVVLPVPSHLSVQRGNWKGELPHSSLWNTFTTSENEDALTPYRELVSLAPDQMVDLLGSYRAYQKLHPKADLYGTFESHWSSLGIAVAAQAAMKKLAARGWQLNPSEPLLAGKAEPQYDHDFPNHLILPKFLTTNLSRFSWEEELYRLKDAEHSRPGRLIVAGTSCAARHRESRFGMGRVLADALGMPLVDYSKERYWIQGSFERMRETGFKLRNGDLLVWEVPVKSVVPENLQITLPEIEPAEKSPSETL